MHKNHWFFFSFWFSVSTMVAQPAIISFDEIKALGKQAEKYLDHDLDSTRYYLELIATQHLPQKLFNESPYNWDALGLFYSSIGEVEAAQNLYQTALSEATESGDSIAIGLALSGQGDCYITMGNRTKVLEKHIEALAVNERVNEEKSARNLNVIGVIHGKQGKNKEAIELLQKAIRLNQKYNHLRRLINNYYNLSVIYSQVDSLDQALSYARKGIQQSRISENSDLISGGEHILGDIYAEHGEVDKAIKHYRRSATNSSKGSYIDAVTAGYEWARLLRLKEEFGASKDRALQTLEQAKKINLYFVQMKIHKLLAENYFDLQASREAYLHLAAHSNLMDSLRNDRNQKQLLLLQEEFDATQRKQEIILLKQANELEQTKTEKAMFVRNFTIAFSLLLAIYLYFLYHRYRENQRNFQLVTKQKQKIEEQAYEKGLLLQEIQHRTKNNLVIIQSLLNTKYRNTNNLAAKNLIEESRHQVEAISILHEQLSNNNQYRQVGSKNYIQSLVHGFQRALPSDQRITFNCEIEEIELPVDLAIPLGLIINEAITNALKYAFPKLTTKENRITIQLSQDCSGKCELLIEDNGIGIAEAKPSTLNGGTGLRLLRGLARQIKGQMQMINQNGMLIKLQFPIL